ncbi:MAG: hypothetical protein ACTHJN_13395 [Ginsengibacter sp.]
MNYDIHLRGSENDNGLIEVDRLNLLTQSTKEIARKALMLRVGGFSEIRASKNLMKALSIFLERVGGNKTEGTYLLLNCEHFEKNIESLQLNAFKPAEELLQLTPMALVIQTFRAALIEEEDKEYLDKPLLKTLLKFKKNFTNSNEVIYLSNRSSVPAIEVTVNDFNKIEDLEESIPEPNKVMINGKLDEMKYSKSKLVLITDQGPVNAFSKDASTIYSLKDYFGKELTITGMAHYKPGGKLSFIEIQDFTEPGEGDKVFSRLPHAMSVQQQIAFEMKSGKSKNPLKDITGQWPGDETLEDLLKLLDE